jgi:hypothetical protein
MKKLIFILPLFLALTAFADIAEDAEAPTERPIPEFSEMILPLKDEAAKDPSFVKFREAFVKAVNKKDLKALLKHVDLKIKNSFGGNDGVEEFKQTWKLRKNPAKSELWAELGKVMSLGGGFMESSFAAPYIYAHWPDEFDAFDYSVVVSDKAVLRKQASAASPILRPLKREIVFVIDSGEDKAQWVEVATFDKLRGWVRATNIHSPVGYRALFAKKNGAWKMTYFIAGD